MLSEIQLKNALHTPSIDKKTQILLCLACEPLRPLLVKDIRLIAARAGLSAVKRKSWNVTSTLRSLKGLAIRTEEGWELTDAGKLEVSLITGQGFTLPSSSLRTLLPSINSNEAAVFIEESIGCVEAKLYRAAVVFSWVGAVAVLYNHVIANHLATFNAEASKRNPKWKTAKNTDDLSRMKENDFLQILEHLSIIGKNVKGELENCLKLRNGCGHPNSLTVAEHKVNSHIETLILNVFKKFI